MSSDGLSIGLREVYEAVISLRDSFEKHAASTAVEIALLKQDVSNLKDKSARRWKTNLALLAAGCSLIGAFVAPIVYR